MSLLNKKRKNSYVQDEEKLDSKTALELENELETEDDFDKNEDEIESNNTSEDLSYSKSKKNFSQNTLDLYFNEVNRHKLLTKSEEKDLGTIINKTQKEILICLCITEMMRDFIIKIKNEIIITPFNELHKFIDVEYFGVDYSTESHTQLINQILVLINNFLHVHENFLSKNKKSISCLDFSKLKGVDKVLDAFYWIQLNRQLLVELLETVKSKAKETLVYYDVIQKCRSNKKKKKAEANHRLLEAEKKFGMKFDRVLEFIDRIDSFQNDQNKAKSKMVLSNLRLVIFTARGFYDNELKFPDMVQFGNLGLLKAIERFDFNLGNRFSTYAIWWTKQLITRKIQKAKLIHIPSHLSEELQRFNKVKRDLMNKTTVESGDTTTDSEICKIMNTDHNKIKKAQRESQRIRSLDAHIGDGQGGVTAAEVLKYHTTNLSSIYENYEASQAIAISFSSGISAKTEYSIRVKNLNKHETQSMFIKKSPGSLVSKSNNLSYKCKQYLLTNKVGDYSDINKIANMKNNYRLCVKDIQNIRKNTQLMELKFLENYNYGVNVRYNRNSKSKSDLFKQKTQLKHYKLKLKTL